MGEEATRQVVQDAVQAVDRDIRQPEAVAAHGIGRRAALLRNGLIRCAGADDGHRACMRARAKLGAAGMKTLAKPSAHVKQCPPLRFAPCRAGQLQGAVLAGSAPGRRGCLRAPDARSVSMRAAALYVTSGIKCCTSLCTCARTCRARFDFLVFYVLFVLYIISLFRFPFFVLTIASFDFE